MSRRQRPNSEPTFPAKGCGFCHEIQDRKRELIDLLEEFSDRDHIVQQLVNRVLCLPHGTAEIRRWKRPENKKCLVEALGR
jgi:hypothetical protein